MAINHGNEATEHVLDTWHGLSPADMLDTLTEQERDEYERVRFSRDDDETVYGAAC